MDEPSRKLSWFTLMMAIAASIGTPTRYVHVASWTLRSNWEQNKETLYDVAGSFVEVTGATTE